MLIASDHRMQCLSIETIGSLLCERMLTVLFDVWILSCAHCFPAPSLWKTLQEMCSSWRHHDALVAQWHRVNVAFTMRLLHNIYGTAPQLPTPQGIFFGVLQILHISVIFTRTMLASVGISCNCVSVCLSKVCVLLNS